jgi:hypothetical protein
MEKLSITISVAVPEEILHLHPQVLFQPVLKRETEPRFSRLTRQSGKTRVTVPAPVGASDFDPLFYTIAVQIRGLTAGRRGRCRRP